MSKIHSDYFSYRKCTFGNSRGKEGTGRVAMWKCLNIPAVYTFENSLCGGMPNGAAPHFTPEVLGSNGVALCKALLIF